jgi:hypothetical protein
MSKLRKSDIVVALVNLIGALLLVYMAWMYYHSVDASGPGQRAYAQSNHVKYKLERLEITEEMLDVVHYWIFTISAGLMCLSASALLVWRKQLM